MMNSIQQTTTMAMTPKKRSIDDQEDTVEGVENNGDNSTTNEPTTADTVHFFSEFSMLTYRRLSF
jgi:hypothetical protein